MGTLAFRAPGVRAMGSITPRCIHTNPQLRRYAPSFYFLDGNLSRDRGNSPTSLIRCGMILGKVTITGLYAPTIIGVTQSAYTSGATSLTVAAADAVEIARRVGASGNLSSYAPPTSTGVVAVKAITFSAVNQSTGVLTVSDIGANVAAGTPIISTDGSGVALTIFDNDQGYPMDVLDTGGASINQPISRFLVGGDLYANQIIDLTSLNASAEAYIKAQLNANGATFTFDDDR
jgi:hypothetical protein